MTTNAGVLPGFFLGFLDGSASYVLWAFPRRLACSEASEETTSSTSDNPLERSGLTGGKGDLFSLVENRVFPAVAIIGPQAYFGAILFTFIFAIFGVFIWLVGSAYYRDAYSPGIIAGGSVLVASACSLLALTSYSDPGFIRKGPCPGELPLLELEKEAVHTQDEAAAREGQPTVACNGSAVPELPVPSEKRDRRSSRGEGSHSRVRQSFNRRVCRRCCIFPPPHAFHCTTCKGCFRRLDHHCPWMGQVDRPARRSAF